MWSQDFAGWASIFIGAVSVGPALHPLMGVRRSKGRSGAPKAEVWSRLLVGPGLLVNGVLYLRYPRYPHGTWLVWIPWTLFAAGLIPLIVSWIVSRRRAKRMDPSSATPSLSSADVPGPGPSFAPDASTAGLIERIKNVKFSTTRFAPGYDEEEVDTFLDKLVTVLGEGGQLDRSELRDIKFSQTRLRPGYVMPDVHTFLDEVAQATW